MINKSSNSIPIKLNYSSCSDIKLYDLAPATRPAAWPTECGLTSIVAGWAQAGLCTGRRSLWSAALLPGDPLLPVGADQRGALAGGETSVGAGARLWRLRGQGSVRTRARWRGSVRARWTSCHGGGQEEGEEKVVEQHGSWSPEQLGARSRYAGGYNLAGSIYRALHVIHLNRALFER